MQIEAVEVLVEDEDGDVGNRTEISEVLYFEWHPYLHYVLCNDLNETDEEHQSRVDEELVDYAETNFIG